MQGYCDSLGANRKKPPLGSETPGQSRNPETEGFQGFVLAEMERFEFYWERENLCKSVRVVLVPQGFPDFRV